MSDANISFSGSGLLFPIHVGALLALQHASVVSTVRGVSGTSGGSIIAALVARGFTVREMEQHLRSVSIDDMIGFNPLALLRMSYCDGNKIDKALFDVFGDKKMCDTVMPLYIMTSDVHAGEPFMFSSEATPDVLIRVAVRASIAIPFVLPPVEYEGRTLVDGMLFSSIPFWAFDKSDVPTIAIGIQPRSERNFLKKPRMFPSYAVRIFEMSMKGLARMHVRLSDSENDVTLHMLDAGEFDLLGEYKESILVSRGYELMRRRIASAREENLADLHRSTLTTLRLERAFGTISDIDATKEEVEAAKNTMSSYIATLKARKAQGDAT